MSTCTKWVDKLVITCRNWSDQLDYECTSWADEGSNECSQWADQGSSHCTSWEECHWYTPWNCIAGLFCRAWYWVAKWVCIAYYWVAKWVCKAFAWVVKAVCVVFSWALELVCVAWDTLLCAVLSVVRWVSKLGRSSAERSRIKHVFVLALENRSFDHMLAFSGISGTDLQGNPTPFNAGFSPLTPSNINPNTALPVSAAQPADFALKDVDADPGHEFDNTVTSLCGGGVSFAAGTAYPAINNSGFIRNYIDSGAADPERVMRCFSPSQLPVLNQLAREFAVCDNWFSSLPGPTFPNRYFMLAGTSGGLDDSPGKFDIVTATTVEGYRFENGNIFDLLDSNCMSWKIFEGDDFPVAFTLKGMNLNALQGRLKDFDDFVSEVGAASFDEKFVFIEPKYGAHKFDVTGPADFTCGNSMHPLDDVTRGEKLVKKVYETIRNSPHWEHSLLIVTFDEHGGFFDHVSPGQTTPPGDLQTASYVKRGFMFDRLGVRVPALVISPLVKKGVIDHTVYDHTSILATIERLFGIGSLTDRDSNAADLRHLLSLNAPRADAPIQLVAPAVNPNPLACEEDDDENADRLMLERSEMRVAKASGRYRDKEVSTYRVPRSQVGFLQAALLKVLSVAESPDHREWLNEYRHIETGVDAAIFMADAQLLIRHKMDLKKMERKHRREQQKNNR